MYLNVKVTIDKVERQMRKGFVSAFAVLLLLLSAAVPAAFAELERVGPTAVANGYPAWYQDKTGLTLEFCQPLNQAELDGGWCLLLPADTSVPEVFPTPFADEHFWYAADAAIPYALPLPAGGTSSAILVIGLEGAFGVGPVLAGDQIAFSRIRIVIRNLPYSGTYTVYHPYGTEVFENQVAGERLFVTEDIGITCAPGNFECALLGRIGPFLLPSLTPGGAELAAVPGPVAGKLYIADPARIGPVTGSPLPPFSSGGVTRNHNIFRIEGPNGFAIETYDFTLMGRVFTGSIPGKLAVNRASYARNGSTKLDVFATAFPTTQGRLPATSPVPAVTPVLAYYEAPCAVTPTGALTEPPGLTGVQMYNAGNTFWGQSQPLAIPVAVCVEDYTARDATGQVVPAFFQAPVTDQVTITEALYSPANGGSLSVKAVSSDQNLLNPPTLDLAGFGPLTNGQIQVTPLAAPPARVRVVSSPRGAIAELQVSTLVGVPGGGGIPVAVTDLVTILEDSGTTNINVLANDTYNGGAIPAGAVVNIVGAPRLGTAVVNLDQTINFTPFLNANGTEGIAYTVTVGTAVSSVAYVTINITPVNDAPVAVNDSTATTVNTSTTINVLANDTDVDGQADLASAVNLALTSSPLGSSATLSGGAGGLVTFSANTAGTYTFTYQAQDQGGLPSANTATVTVTVSAAETINIAIAEYRRDQLRLRVNGGDSIHAGQTLTIYLTTGVTGTVVSTAGTAVVDGAGAWALDLRGVTLPTGATAVRVTSPLGGRADRVLSIR